MFTMAKVHPKHASQAKEITKTILLLLGAGVAITAAGSVNGKAAPVLLKAFGRYSVYRIRETVMRLRLLGYVHYEVRDASAPIKLTPKGMTRVAKFELRNFIPSQRRGQWDYLWRLVSFDIPEQIFYKRHALRRELELAGFYPLQRSVFVCPYPCEMAVRKLCDKLHVSRFVVCTATSSLGPQEEKVRKHFFDEGRR